MLTWLTHQAFGLVAVIGVMYVVVGSTCILPPVHREHPVSDLRRKAIYVIHIMGTLCDNRVEWIF